MAFFYDRLGGLRTLATDTGAVMARNFEETAANAAIEQVEGAVAGLAIGAVRGRYGDGALNVGKSQLKTKNPDGTDGAPQTDAKGNPVYDPNSGVPIPLLAGGLMSVASFAISKTGKSVLARDHVRSFGAIVASHGWAMIGERVGAKWKQKADQQAAQQGNPSGGYMAGDRYPVRELHAQSIDGAVLTPEEQAAFYKGMQNG